MKHKLGQFLRKLADWIADPFVFIGAVLVHLIFLTISVLSGSFSKVWVLFDGIATTTSFLSLFLLHYANKHDSMAQQIQQKELIVRLNEPRSELANIEEEDDETLKEIKEEFNQEIRQK